MIVVLDTSSLYGDVYAERQWAETLFSAAAAGDELEVWVPSVVIEELVRKFPERLEELIRTVRQRRNDASAFGWTMPPIPDLDDEVEGYRSKLLERLRSAGVKIAPSPARAGLIAEWVAQRRKPIPGDGSGTVDAQIWLTVAEAAESDRVTLITSNSEDFCDPEDHGRPHEVLRDDLEGWGISPARIEIQSRILDFNERHVAPSRQATEQAKRLLADPSQRRDLIGEIEGAIAWYPLDDPEDWGLGVDIEEANFGSFDLGALRLVRADSGEKGVYLTLEAYGAASLDLWIYRPDALALGDDSPIVVDDWEWDEWNVSARVESEVSLLLEVLYADDSFAVSVDGLAPIDNGQVLFLLESWVKAAPQSALEVVAEDFDIPGEQEATAVHARDVEAFYFKDGALFLRGAFSVDYASPVDGELIAENVEEHVVDLRIEEPDLEGPGWGEISQALNAFPTIT